MLQEPVICPNPGPNRSSPHPPTLFNVNFSIYPYVFQVTSPLQIFRQILYMHFSYFQCLLHVPPLFPYPEISKTWPCGVIFLSKKQMVVISTSVTVGRQRVAWSRTIGSGKMGQRHGGDSLSHFCPPSVRHQSHPPSDYNVGAIRGRDSIMWTDTETSERD